MLQRGISEHQGRKRYGRIEGLSGCGLSLLGDYFDKGYLWGGRCIKFQAYGGVSRKRAWDCGQLESFAQPGEGDNEKNSGVPKRLLTLYRGGKRAESSKKNRVRGRREAFFGKTAATT